MENGKKISCLGDRIEVALPVGFDRAADEVIAEKFPYDLKPQEVYQDITGRKIITFNFLEKRLEENQIDGAIREIQRMIGHIYPESIKEQAKSFRTKDVKIGYFSFVTGGLIYDQVHMLFICSFFGNMIFGSYHFPEQYEWEEKVVLLQVVRGIRIKQNVKRKERGKHEGNRI